MASLGEVLKTESPAIRSMMTSSGTLSDATKLRESPVWANSLSSRTAWEALRGKPSRIQSYWMNRSRSSVPVQQHIDGECEGVRISEPCPSWLQARVRRPGGLLRLQAGLCYHGISLLLLQIGPAHSRTHLQLASFVPPPFPVLSLSRSRSARADRPQLYQYHIVPAASR